MEIILGWRILYLTNKAPNVWTAERYGVTICARTKAELTLILTLRKAI